jgi:hypothetical protein
VDCDTRPIDINPVTLFGDKVRFQQRKLNDGGLSRSLWNRHSYQSYLEISTALVVRQNPLEF